MSQPDLYNMGLKALLKNKNGEVLALQLPEGVPGAGLYDLPGGRIDDNEFDMEYLYSLDRELREELGDDFTYEVNKYPVSIGRRRVRYDGSNTPVLLVLFEGIVLSDQINMSSEHAQYAWVNLDLVEIENVFEPGIVPAIKMYLERVGHA